MMIRTRLVAGLSLCTALVALAGCFTSNYVPVRHYAVVPNVDVTPAEPIDVSLGVRSLTFAKPYREPLVYRDEAYTINFIDFQEWAELPSVTITRALIDALAASGRFRDVGLAPELHRPDLILVGELRAFDEVRTGQTWRAYCQLRFELRPALTERVLWAETLSASEPLPANDSIGFAQAVSKAVSSIVEEATRKIISHAGNAEE